MELLTITDRATVSVPKPVLFITGRQHPGESSASFIMEGIITFLLSGDPTATQLLQRFEIQVRAQPGLCLKHASDWSISSC